MPPLAPPKGRFTTAVFHVISDARASISSRSTSRVVPQAALHRAARVVVLYAIPLEGAYLSVVEFDGHLHRHLTQRGREQRLDALPTSMMRAAFVK
jgi:hypothetical protein